MIVIGELYSMHYSPALCWKKPGCEACINNTFEYTFFNSCASHSIKLCGCPLRTEISEILYFRLEMTDNEQSYAEGIDRPDSPSILTCSDTNPRSSLQTG